MVWTLACLAALLLGPPSDAPPLQRPGQRKPAPAPAPTPAPKPTVKPAPPSPPEPTPTPKPAPAPAPPPTSDAPIVQRPGQPKPKRPPEPAPEPAPTPAPAASEAPAAPDPDAPVVQRPGHRATTPLDDPDGLIVPLPGQPLTPFDYPDGPHVLPPSLAARDFGYATQVWEDERPPTVERERRVQARAGRPDRTGFIWQLGVGYTSAFVITEAMIPSAKIDGFLGGSLARRNTHRGTRKSGIGMLGEVELPVGLHRYHFAVTGLVGPRNTFYWRFNTGLSFNRRTPLIGMGGNVGVGIDLGRDRITELTIAISASIDAGAASAASLGLTASVLRF